MALDAHTPAGPCDDECGCVTPSGETSSGSAPVQLTVKPAATADTPIACTLGAADMPGRIADWQAALAAVVARQPIDGGVRLVLPPGASLAALAELANAEQACCMFFRFAITIDGRGAALEVRAPTEAIDIVHSLFGAPT